MTLFVSLLCIVAGIWLLLQFAPQAHLEILVDASCDNPDFILASVSLQNTSRSRIGKQTILFQSLGYDVRKAGLLGDHVPFNTSEVRNGEEPLEWHEPREIFREVDFLFPGEILTTECLVPRPKGDAVVHIGLQFNASTGATENLIGRFFTLNSRWETSAFHLSADQS